jgi:hypothetical protein
MHICSIGLDIAAGVLVLASVGIFLAHAVDTYRAQ